MDVSVFDCDYRSSMPLPGIDNQGNKVISGKIPKYLNETSIDTRQDSINHTIILSVLIIYFFHPIPLSPESNFDPMTPNRTICFVVTHVRGWFYCTFSYQIIFPLKPSRFSTNYYSTTLWRFTMTRFKTKQTYYHLLNIYYTLFRTSVLLFSHRNAVWLR